MAGNEGSIKKYSVFEAVWIATALLSMELYDAHGVESIGYYYFKQSEIVKKAQTLTNDTVDAARVSWWCCADAKKHIYNYLRGDNGNTRRLTAPNELAEKTIPENLDSNDVLEMNGRSIYMEELMYFVNEQYSPIVNAKTSFHPKGKFDSWEVISETELWKTCDLSFFKYNGSGIPIQIRWFFEAEELVAGDKKEIVLEYDGNEYPAEVTKSKSTNEVTRIFFRNNELQAHFAKYDTPDNYPICKFVKVKAGKFKVSFETVGETVDINYLWILDYLENNREVPYKDPTKPGLTQEERDGFLAVKANGQKVVAELKKIHVACSEKFNLKKCEKVSWDDGSHTKTKNYLWVPMKYMEYADRQESISVFVEPIDESVARFRVSLELRNDKADAKAVENYHKHLEMPLNEAAQLIYVAGSNEFSRPERVYDQQKIIIEKVKNKELSKVQICRYIDKAEFSTNSKIHEAIFEAVAALLPYYEYVLGIKKHEYWPSLEEYDPGITVEKWLELLTDNKITNETTLTMLFQILELGGESTCSNLEKQFGGSAHAYNSWGRTLGEHVYKKTGCPLCKDGDRERYYTIPFVGRSIVEDGRSRYSWKLRNELKEALESNMMSELNKKLQKRAKEQIKTFRERANRPSYAKNMILYGPPGTGKTYATVVYAVAIIENKSVDDVKEEAYDDVFERYNQYKAGGEVTFTTFHQSYGYEEFIEGIKPVVGEGGIGYTIEDGVFKSFCEDAKMPENKIVDHNAKIWKVVLQSGNLVSANTVKFECFNEGKIMYDWKTKEEHAGTYAFSQISHFQEKVNVGDIVVTYAGSGTDIDAIGVVTGDAEYDDKKPSFRWSRAVEWLEINKVRNIKELNGNKYLDNDQLQHLKRVSIAELLKLVEPLAFKPNDKNYVFIIDEINRGNISKIFGELITLIEETKRAGMDEEASAILPYSAQPFSVPSNVYILGTMNTADRSIALMDTALRRRFEFIEMMPDVDVLRKIGADKIEDLDVAMMLGVINERITFLYDREHTIGHAFFTKIAKKPTVTTLKSIFEKSVIPLLQEYFYEDYQKIQLVLGDNGKSDDTHKFILDSEVKVKDIFKGSVDDVIDLPEKKYTINPDAFDNIDSYKEII